MVAAGVIDYICADDSCVQMKTAILEIDYSPAKEIAIRILSSDLQPKVSYEFTAQEIITANAEKQWKNTKSSRPKTAERIKREKGYQ